MLSGEHACEAYPPTLKSRLLVHIHSSWRKNCKPRERALQSEFQQFHDLDLVGMDEFKYQDVANGEEGAALAAREPPWAYGSDIIWFD
jgi:hypothetical protein